MRRSLHPDDEGLSAFLDGEDPGAGPHVSSCESCQTRLEILRRAATAVAAPVPTLPDNLRDAAITRAVAAARPRRAWSVRPRWSAMPRWAPAVAAAAVVLIAVTVIAVRDDGSNDRLTATRAPATTTATESKGFALQTAPEAATSGAADSAARTSAGSAAAGGSGQAASAPAAAAAPRPGAPDGDIGALSTPSELRARVEPRLRERTGSTSAAAAEGASPMAARSDAPASPPPTVTHPCEARARQVGAGSDRLIFAANADWQKRPAVVLGFAGATRSDGTTPVSVYVTAANDCAVLYSQAYGP